MVIFRAICLALLCGVTAALEWKHHHHHNQAHQKTQHHSEAHRALKLRGRRAALRDAIHRRFKGCAEYDPTVFKLHDLPDVDPESLADSEVIESGEGKGDCGKVSQIIGKWTKSARIGRLSAEAQNSATAADKAADQARDAKDKAIEAKEAAEEVGGEPADAAAATAQTAADDAEDMATAANDAATDVTTQVETVKGQFGSMGGFDVEDSDVMDLKDKTEKARVAERDAIKAAEYAIEKAESAKKQMLGSIDGAVTMLEKAMEKAEDFADKAKDVKQKAVWSATEASKVFEAAEEISTQLTGKIDANEGDQGPVLQSLQDGLNDEISGGKDARAALCAEEGEECDDDSAVGAMEAAIEDVDSKRESLKTAHDAVKMDANPAGLGKIAEEVGEMEKATEDLEKKIGVVDMKADTLSQRKKSVAKFGEKASDYGIDWKPPPATPLGAPTGPMPDF